MSVDVITLAQRANQRPHSSCLFILISYILVNPFTFNCIFKNVLYVVEAADLPA